MNMIRRSSQISFMKKIFKTNQNEYLKTDRQGNSCLRTTDANKLNKNKFI